MQVDSKEAKLAILAWMNQSMIDPGYADMRLTLKSDGEPAMTALKGAVALKRGCETFIIHSPARESNSNGAVEMAIKTWKGQMRKIALHLEDRLKVKVNANHNFCLGWQCGLATSSLSTRCAMAELPMN